MKAEDVTDTLKMALKASGCDQELPGDDVAGEVVKDRGQVEPAPTDDLEVGEVGLPELVGRAVVLSLNSSAALITTKAGLVIRSWAFSSR